MRSISRKNQFHEIFFFLFQSSVASNRGLKATETVLKYLEKIDQPEEEKVKVSTLHYGLSAKNILRETNNLMVSKIAIFTLL